ncbi:hypothetical protein [Candidatus Tisiphia endosymbiont of Nedyus quadrimaculatus]|uniref:hypothetical protein n=1 Tax=Candidatus Tisiphia endosymbiont of Nedyus quadrimaculatus TaxID=3139332 RepID=UPI00345ECF19
MDRAPIDAINNTKNEIKRVAHNTIINLKDYLLTPIVPSSLLDQGFADDNIANLQCISEGGWDIVMIGDSSNGIS